VDAKAGEDRGADRSDAPKPAEEYGPGDGGEERQQSRELGSVNWECHATDCFVSFDVRKVLRLYSSKNEDPTDGDRRNGYKVHRMVST